MHDIFISYSREDLNRARSISKALEKQGFEIWWDRKIPPGKSFDQVIEEAIDSSKCVMVLWSKHSVNSTWARTEAEEGRNRGILIPVLIEDVKIPLSFRNIQAANLIDWVDNPNDPNFQSLLSAIRFIVQDVSLSQDLSKNLENALENFPSNKKDSLRKTENKKPNKDSDKNKYVQFSEPEDEISKIKIKSSILDKPKKNNRFKQKKTYTIAIIVSMLAIASFAWFQLSKYQLGNDLTNPEENYNVKTQDSMEVVDWQKIIRDSSVSDINSYLKAYPNGKYSELANNLLVSIQDNEAWQNAVDEKSKQAYENYLKKYPNGNYSIKAQSKISELDNLKIGQKYLGGIIFYIDDSSEHGLIAAENDQSRGSNFNNANEICLTLNLNNYDDWYLPTREELNKLYENRKIVDGFEHFYYWTSTEKDANTAWRINFNDRGINAAINKNGKIYVRAIRKF